MFSQSKWIFREDAVEFIKEDSILVTHHSRGRKRLEEQEIPLPFSKMGRETREK